MSRTSLMPFKDDGPRARAVFTEIQSMIDLAPNIPLKNRSMWEDRLAVARHQDFLDARARG